MRSGNILFRISFAAHHELLSTYDSTVSSFYLAFYGRPADMSGLAFWSQQLANNNGDLGAITQAFAASEEAQVRFGTDSVAERIAEIYQQLFNRAPESEGLAFWTNAIEQGNASMADVAVSILKGAQGSDASLAQLRQQAVDAFSAEVKESGSEYAGYASIEAARILVRAVTADAGADDLAALVKAAVSFADTATKTPQVVEAIAVNTTLLALFDTARGVKEPVELATALADTAKAAAGDPVTLESLLRGGGMDKVLKVMPAKATLKDVVDALAKGGLPAAVEVVYPTTPATPANPTPAFGLNLSFEKVSAGDFDLDLKDNITNKSLVDVTFSYTGADLRAGQHVEYTVNGKDWIKADVDVFASTNTVVLKNVHLLVPQVSVVVEGDGALPFPFDIEDIPLPNATTTIGVRVADSGGATSKAFEQKIVFDGYVAKPVVALQNDTSNGMPGGDHDLLTRDGTLKEIVLEPGAKVEYLVLAQQQTPVDNDGGSAGDGGDAPVLGDGADDGGDLGGIEGDEASDDDVVDVGPFSLPSGSNLPISNTNNGSIQIPTDAKWSSKPVYAEGVNTVFVRVTDLAGNQKISQLTFTLDTIAPTNKIDFLSVSGATAPGSTKTTLDDADILFSYDGVLDSGSIVEYRIGGEWLELDTTYYSNGEISVPVTNLKGADPIVEVRIVDGAGNEGKPFGVEIDGPAIKDALNVAAGSDMESLSILSSITGQLYVSMNNIDTPLTINGHDALVSKDVAALVGAQESVKSGVLKVANKSTELIEEDGTVVGLGTSGDDDEISGQFVLGFGGNDKLFGTDGNDFLSGGQGNDTVYGGKGGDAIIVFGHDTVVYKSTADSNLSGMANATSGATAQEQSQTTDYVMVVPGGLVTFDLSALQFAGGVQNAGSLSPSMHSLSYLGELTTAYNTVATSQFDAVLFADASGSTKTLVVNNGDHVIDGNDLVITIVGSGEIHLDGQGNVVFGMID